MVFSATLAPTFLVWTHCGAPKESDIFIMKKDTKQDHDNGKFLTKWLQPCNEKVVDELLYVCRGLVLVFPISRVWVRVLDMTRISSV